MKIQTGKDLIQFQQTDSKGAPLHKLGRELEKTHFKPCQELAIQLAPHNKLSEFIAW